MASRKPASGKKSKSSKPSKQRDSVWKQFYRSRKRDIWGLVALIAALLSAMGIWVDAAGPVGVGIDRAVGFCIGLVKYAVPLLLAAVGWLFFYLQRAKIDKEHVHMPVRIAGAGLMGLSVVGLFHFMGGQPSWGDAVADFEGAGGYLGFFLGALFRRLLSTPGAIVLLAALGLFGWMAASGASLKAVGRGILAALRKLWALAVTFVRFLVSERRPLSESSEPASEQTAAASAAGSAPAGSAPAAEGDFSGATDYSYVADEPHLRTPLFIPTTEELTPPQEAPESASPSSDSLSTDSFSTPAAAASASPGANGWRLPSLDLLDRSAEQSLDSDFIARRGKALEESLAAHGVDARLVGMVTGPTVTRYELSLAEGVKVARFTALSKDMAYAMASPDVRILAPIPGRQAVGVEVPNMKRQMVTLGDILSSSEAAACTHPLDVALGQDITGRAVLANLGHMPHLLIAGATGSGKSSCVNSMITSILMRCTPDQVRMILVDPKMVEMRQYAGVPHLLTQPVIDPKKAANALAWAVKEMERRYSLLSAAGCRDIGGYNELYEASQSSPEGLSYSDYDDEEELQRLPFIVVVVDELSDLMMVAPRDVEDCIWRLAQMARAVGIHLVIATQRPSTNVITGVIKANVPSRLAFSVSSLTDSRVILDQAGAERLVGSGDMLMLDASSSTPQRIQGAWVGESEIRKVTAVWRRQSSGEESSSSEITGEDLAPSIGGAAGSNGDGDDELLAQAKELVVNSQLGSTSMLQRKLRVGFARAGRLMDLLEERGVVGPSEGSKAREVLMTPDELQAEREAAAGGLT